MLISDLAGIVTVVVVVVVVCVCVCVCVCGTGTGMEGVSVLAWGKASERQLGLGEMEEPFISVPKLVIMYVCMYVIWL